MGNEGEKLYRCVSYRTVTCNKKRVFLLEGTATQQFRVKCYVSESVIPMWAEANLWALSPRTQAWTCVHINRSIRVIRNSLVCVWIYEIASTCPSSIFPHPPFQFLYLTRIIEYRSKCKHVQEVLDLPHAETRHSLQAGRYKTCTNLSLCRHYRL